MMNKVQLKMNPNTSDEVSTAQIPFQELISSLNGLWKGTEFCDVSIILNNKEYPVHKIILASLSPYFKNLFGSGFSESEMNKIEIKGINTASFELVLKYVYEGSCVITHDNVQDVLHAANFLQIGSLFDQCSDYLEKNMNAANCLGILGLAKLYHSDDLQMKAKEYSLKNFTGVCKEDEFLELDTEDLIDMINSDLLDIKKKEDEVQVFKAVIRWVKYNKEDRTVVLPKVLTHVRLAHIPANIIHSSGEAVQAIQDSLTCHRLLLRAMLYQSVPNCRLELQSSVSRRRPQWSLNEVMLMFGEQISTGEEVLLRIAEDGRYAPDPVITPPKIFNSWYISNCQTHCFGVDGEFLFRYDGKSWAGERWGGHGLLFGFASIAGRQFFIGGQKTHPPKLRDNVYESYFDEDVEPLAPLPIALHSPAVASVKGKIYVLGGLDDKQQTVNAVQRYDPDSDTWTQMTPLPVERGQFKACAIDDQIYVCQFFSDIAPATDEKDDSRHVFVYDVTNDIWEAFASLSHSFISGPVPFNGDMFVLTEGGANYGYKRRWLEKYCASSGTWKVFAYFEGYQPMSITGPMLLERPSTKNDPKEPLNFMHLIK